MKPQIQRDMEMLSLYQPTPEQAAAVVRLVDRSLPEPDATLMKEILDITSGAD